MGIAKGKSLADKIREGRQSAALSQTELAKKIGVGQPVISMWELNKAAPNEKQTKKLQSVLGGITEADQADDQSLPALSGWLAKALSRKNLTPYELSVKSGVSPATVYTILNGKAQNPQKKTLQRLESVLAEKFEQPDEKKESPTVQGIGELTDFNPHDPNDQPQTAGVYVFYDISDRPIYVGKATKIADRVNDHKEKFWFKQPIVETAAYIEIANKTLRDQVETVLIQFLKNNAVINKNKTLRD